MSFFLTDEGYVLRLLPLLLGIFPGVYLYDFVFIRGCRAYSLFFILHPKPPHFVVLLAGVNITWACQGFDALTFASRCNDAPMACGSSLIAD
jgi:hypothetical protein